MKSHFWALMGTLIVSFHCLGQTPTQAQHRLQRRMDSQIYWKHQELLRQDPIYTETLNYCQNGGFSQLMTIGWSGSSDVLAASEVLLLDTAGLIRLYKNRFQGSELVLRITSEAFQRALIDCDPSLWQGKQVIAAYIFSDFVGKSAVVVTAAYAITSGLVRSVAQTVLRGLYKLPFAFKQFGVGALAHLTGYNIFYYAQQMPQFLNGENSNTESFQTLSQEIRSDTSVFKERVIAFHQAKLHELQKQLTTETKEENRDKLTEKIVFHSFAIQKLTTK